MTQQCFIFNVDGLMWFPHRQAELLLLCNEFMPIHSTCALKEDWLMPAFRYSAETKSSEEQDSYIAFLFVLSEKLLFTIHHHFVLPARGSSTQNLSSLSLFLTQ